MFTNRVYGLVSLCLIKSISDTWPSHSFFIEYEKALSALPIFGKSLFFENMYNIGKFDTAVATELIN